VCIATGSTAKQMLPQSLADLLSDVAGVQVWSHIPRHHGRGLGSSRELFRGDQEQRAILEQSLANTDAAWNRRMKAKSERNPENIGDYWLVRYANF
jgi:hypothetical protein